MLCDELSERSVFTFKIEGGWVGGDSLCGDRMGRQEVPRGQNHELAVKGCQEILPAVNGLRVGIQLALQTNIS